MSALSSPSKKQEKKQVTSLCYKSCQIWSYVFVHRFTLQDLAGFAKSIFFSIDISSFIEYLVKIIINVFLL